MNLPLTRRLFTPPTGNELVEVEGGTIYYLGAIIGEGHFGAVYECMDEWGNALAAKVLKPLGRPYEEVKQLWLEELHRLEELRHPHITFVRQAFEYRDTFYLVVERCSQSVDALFSIPDFDGAIWLPHIASPVLQALDFIHVRGYVHKDLHPGNIFLAWKSDPMVPTKPPILDVKVGDLGISRLESDINIFGTILAEWMRPPESIDPGEFGLIGRQVDIYHVGLCLLGLLLGRIPRYSQEDVLAGVPRRMAESLTSPYGPVIGRALRRHVAARTPSALQFWRELRNAVALDRRTVDGR